MSLEGIDKLYIDILGDKTEYYYCGLSANREKKNLNSKLLCLFYFVQIYHLCDPEKIYNKVHLNRNMRAK